MTIVYDRSKTVVRWQVAPGEAVPLHPEAVAFAGHYDFDIDVLAAYRPQGKGRVERQVGIVRDHVLAGRAFSAPGNIGTAVNAKPMIMASSTGGRPGGEVRRKIPELLRTPIASRPCQWSS
ncbi:transposase [Streptomyces sp. 3330]|nr:transposase [Streptomyces sp. 3330]